MLQDIDFTNKNKTKESGFIILTIPVLLLLFGFFITSITKDTKPNQFYFETTTQQAMVDVKTALAAYAHRNYRIPCPAAPTPTAADFGVEGALGADNKCASTKGILPFKALGLTEDAAKDEWGNYLTYKVSPDFTMDFSNSDLVEVGSGTEKMLTAPNDAQFFVHELCRTPGWINASGGYNDSNGTAHTITGNANENMFKARFCCASNVSGTGSKTFLAQNQTFLHGQSLANPANLSSDDDGVGDDEIYMSYQRIDSNLAIYDDSKPIPDHWSNWAKSNFNTLAEYFDFIIADKKQNQSFYYNSQFQHNGHGVGNGFGPQRGNSALHSGKFFLEAMEININTDKVKTNEFTMSMSDLGSNNWLEPVQISLDVVDSSGTIIDTVSYVVQTPLADGTSDISPQDGVGELTISLEQLMDNNNQDGLYSLSGNYYDDSANIIIPISSSGYRSNWAQASMDLFDASKASLTSKLAAANLTINDVSIGRLKMNSTHTSMGFGSITYGSPGVSTPTDLVIRKESTIPNTPGDERLTERTDSAPYGDSDTPLAPTDPVAQDFEAAAYALISHGPDGEGSYQADGSLLDNIPNANENPDEVANHSDDREVRDIRKINSTNPAEKFDDIIMWDSQITLYNALRNGTCESSQAL